MSQHSTTPKFGASHRYPEYAGAYSASGSYGCHNSGCGCYGKHGGLLGLFDLSASDAFTIGAVGILAGIAIFLAWQVTQGKRKKRGKFHNFQC